MREADVGVRHLPLARVAAQLPAGMDEAAWNAVRPNLSRISEAAEWWQVVHGRVAAADFAAEDRAYLAEAAEVLAGTGTDWAALTGALKERTGRKGKALFLPLRQALTGHDHGPEMAALLPLIGLYKALARLRAAGI